MRALSTILLLFASTLLFANTIVVGKDRPIKNLKAAVELAKNGDTIVLSKGVYAEGRIVINKRIALMGNGWPILDGLGKNEILVVSGHGIVIRGIHFANAGYSSMDDYAAIKVIDANNVLIEKNQVTNASFAIHFANTTNSVVRGNIIRGTNKSEHSSGNGIHLWKCEGMTVEGNSVHGHRDGIYFEFVTRSTIRGNVSERNVRYGLHFMFSNDNAYIGNTFRNNGAGVAVMYTRNVLMENNIFDKNWGSAAYGILLKDITDSRIRNNQFLQNTIAIHMEGSSRIEVARNVFRGNGWAVKVQASCDDNRFDNNNFFGNSFDIATNGARSLNLFNNNYWDKYEGYDINRDGIGDIPHHPVSMYAMIVEKNPTTLILMRSFMVSLLDKAEKAIPSLTPENLVDPKPMMKPNKL